MRLRNLATALVLLGAGAGVLGWRAHIGQETRRRDAIERSLLRTWLLEETDLRRTASAAGISLHRPEIVPLNRRRLGARAEGDDFHAFVQRCTSCHSTPDPSMHTPGEWGTVLHRMNGWIDKAGVLPMEAAEREALTRFLDRTAPPASR